MDADVIPTADAEALAAAATDWMVARIAEIDGPVSICLSGGSTPKRLYRNLAKLPLPFERLNWFWGDERCLPVGNPLRNETMVREALLDHVPVPVANVYPIPPGPDPQTAAQAYETVLKTWYGAPLLDPARPLFDIMLLGLGSDGHTASLFPGMPALKETGHWAVATEAGLEPFVPRVTLTYPALASSSHTAFLVAGADKREKLAQALTGGDVPAAAIRSRSPIQWFVDKAALG